MSAITMPLSLLKNPDNLDLGISWLLHIESPVVNNAINSRKPNFLVYQSKEILHIIERNNKKKFD